MAFRITESHKLSDDIEDILSAAVKHSILQVSPLRKSKGGHYTEPVYHLNRIFAPVLSLLPSARDTLSIPAEILNNLIDDETIVQKFLDKTLERQIKKGKRNISDKSTKKKQIQSSLEVFFNSS